MFCRSGDRDLSERNLDLRFFSVNSVNFQTGSRVHKSRRLCARADAQIHVGALAPGFPTGEKHLIQ